MFKSFIYLLQRKIIYNTSCNKYIIKVENANILYLSSSDLLSIYLIKIATIVIVHIHIRAATCRHTSDSRVTHTSKRLYRPLYTQKTCLTKNLLDRFLVPPQVVLEVAQSAYSRDFRPLHVSWCVKNVLVRTPRENRVFPGTNIGNFI